MSPRRLAPVLLGLALGAGLLKLAACADAPDTATDTAEERADAGANDAADATAPKSLITNPNIIDPNPENGH
jgi:hypothetical protein